jgi:phosphoribosylformylglycinamidine synthase
MMGEKSKNNFIGNTSPNVDAKKNRKLYEAFYKCAKQELIASAISVGLGGLGTALAKTAIAGMLGIDISLQKIPTTTNRDDYALFSESQGRILVTINPKNKTAFERQLKGTAFAQIGKVTKKTDFIVKGLNNKPIIKTSIQKLLNSYKKRFKDY